MPVPSLMSPPASQTAALEAANRALAQALEAKRKACITLQSQNLTLRRELIQARDELRHLRQRMADADRAALELDILDMADQEDTDLTEEGES